jgi:hypothetical protein
MSVEEIFLARLAQVEGLAKESPMMDGEALVVRLDCQRQSCAVIIEVRLPGSDDWEESDHGRLLVFLQNISDEPLNFRAPEFILTGGLTLPWRAGVTAMVNTYRNSFGEVLSWQVPIMGDESPTLLASEVIRILNNCRIIMSRSQDFTS